MCYHEDKGERELLLECVPAAFMGCSLYTDGANFYAYQTAKLTALYAAGKERYTLSVEQRIRDLCMSSDGCHIVRDPLPERIEEMFWTGIANARPASYRTEQVLSIIAEEAEFYFMGDKSLEEVSAVIENRVRLYLVEQE